MNFSRRFFAVAAILVLLVSCGGASNPKEQIIGRWKMIELQQNGVNTPISDAESITFEFFADGSYIINAGVSPRKGTYTLLENGQLTLNDSEVSPFTTNAVFKDGNLHMQIYEGTTSVLRRM